MEDMRSFQVWSGFCLTLQFVQVRPSMVETGACSAEVALVVDRNSGIAENPN
jgi:hypothetical protein